MSLILDKNQILEKLKKRKFHKSSEKLRKYIARTRHIFIKYSNNVTNSCGNEDYINPLLWQLGHVVGFYYNLILRNTNINNIDFEKYYEFYDSHKTPLENRHGDLLLDYQKIIQIYSIVINNIQNYLIKTNISKTDSYLIMLGILHNEMHNEALIFTKLSLNNTIDLPLKKYDEPLINDNVFVYYKSASFKQGSKDSKDNLIFDNEMPQFKTHLNEFFISKYMITENMFLDFIISDGYKNEKYWCRNGKIWKNKNNISLPLYWYYENGYYYKMINNTKFSVKTNLPIMNISYYEAKAYCKWKGVRLPTESEYEYVSTNAGKTKFPWGNEPPCDEKCNINYNNFIKPVNYYKLGNNKKGIAQLIGNVWEWCEELIYPYEGFKIDPVYREMSYPFFGFKKICKGGCFAVSDFLIHPKYRNAQYPDCRIQFIGFRVCRK